MLGRRFCHRKCTSRRKTPLLEEDEFLVQKGDEFLPPEEAARLESWGWWNGFVLERERRKILKECRRRRRWNNGMGYL
jgi:hypothetical protein